MRSAFDSYGSLHTLLAEVMETKDTWNRHRRKRQIIRTRKAKGYNGFHINCSCVCSSCYALYDIFSKYGYLSKNSDGGWIVVLLHGFGHANSCVQRCLYVLLSQGYRRRNSANPPTFRIFLYLSLKKLVLSNFLLFQYQTIQVPSSDDWLGLFYSNDMHVKAKERTHQLTVRWKAPSCVFRITWHQLRLIKTGQKD